MRIRRAITPLVSASLFLSVVAGAVRAQDDDPIAEAIASCRERLAEIQTAVNVAGVGRVGIPREDMRRLREAALVFARAGYSDGCEDIADNIDLLLAGHIVDASEDTREISVANAQPLQDSPELLQAGGVIGNIVVNSALEDLGTVEDTILVEDSPRYLLISYGGVFGVGVFQVPIGAQHVRVTDDGAIIVLDAPVEVLLEAPTTDQFDLLFPEEWTDEVDAYWSNHLTTEPDNAATAISE